MVLVPAVAANPPDWADGTHRLELTLCLPSRADDADGRRIVSRKVFRRHSGRSPGPLLAEAVRLNHGDEFSGTDVDQVNPESNARAGRGVVLEPGISAGRPRREHDVHCGLARSHPLAREATVNIMLRSEEHTSELQSQSNLVCRLLLEK